MRQILILLVMTTAMLSCGQKRELHVHIKEYEWLKEIEAEKRELLKQKAANLAVNYAHKAGEPDVLAQVIVDACAIEINEVVEAASEVKSGEKGGGLKQETAVDEFKETINKDLRRVLWKQITQIINAERAKKQPKPTVKDKNVHEL